jgi:hypothetical protein
MFAEDLVITGERDALRPHTRNNSYLKDVYPGGFSVREVRQETRPTDSPTRKLLRSPLKGEALRAMATTNEKPLSFLSWTKGSLTESASNDIVSGANVDPYGDVAGAFFRESFLPRSRGSKGSLRPSSCRVVDVNSMLGGLNDHRDDTPLADASVGLGVCCRKCYLGLSVILFVCLIQIDDLPITAPSLPSTTQYHDKIFAEKVYQAPVSLPMMLCPMPIRNSSRSRLAGA